MVRFPKRPRRGPLPFRNVFIITIVLFLFTTLLALWFINRAIAPTLLAAAETKAEQIATKAINTAVNKKDVEEELDLEVLINLTKDEEGNITSMSWNPTIVNTFLRNSTQRVQSYLDAVEEGYLPPEGTPLGSEIQDTEELKRMYPIKYDLPIGLATNIPMFANLGPKVPIKLQTIGSVESDVEYNIKEYGINNSFIEIAIKVTANVRVVIPFATREKPISTQVTVFGGVIQGKVPSYYFQGNGSGLGNPNIVPPPTGQ